MGGAGGGGRVKLPGPPTPLPVSGRPLLVLALLPLGGPVACCPCLAFHAVRIAFDRARSCVSASQAHGEKNPGNMHARLPSPRRRQWI